MHASSQSSYWRRGVFSPESALGGIQTRSKHAETHYAREKVNDTPGRQGGSFSPKSERKEPSGGPVKGHAKGVACSEGEGTRPPMEVGSQEMSTRNGTRTRSRKEGRKALHQAN